MGEFTLKVDGKPCNHLSGVGVEKVKEIQQSHKYSDPGFGAYMMCLATTNPAG